MWPKRISKNILFPLIHFESRLVFVHDLLGNTGYLNILRKYSSTHSTIFWIYPTISRNFICYISNILLRVTAIDRRTHSFRATTQLVCQQHLHNKSYEHHKAIPSLKQSRSLNTQEIRFKFAYLSEFGQSIGHWRFVRWVGPERKEQMTQKGK